MSRRKPNRSWVAVAVASAALFAALGGVSTAASAVSSLVNGHNIKRGTVGHKQLAKHSVWNANLALNAVRPANLSGALRAQLATHSGLGPKGPAGPAGQTGPAGQRGPAGTNGSNGSSGANPAAAVGAVPTIAASSGNNTGGTTPKNPDSGDAGDQGWYFTGNGAGGSADLGNGELQLSGVGNDSNTAQGGIGIAKAFANVPLGNLNALSYLWHVNQAAGNQAPTIHLTVTGLTNNSHFGSGFANVVYNPALNGITVNPSVGYSSDAFAGNAKWYSTTNPTIGGQGGQNDPQPLSYFVSNNPNAVIGQISLDNGGSSGASGSWSAGADDLILGFTGSPFTRYDFGG